MSADVLAFDLRAESRRAMLDHSDIKTTMVYTHTNRAAETNAVRRLDGSSDKVVTLLASTAKSAQ